MYNAAMDKKLHVIAENASVENGLQELAIYQYKGGAKKVRYTIHKSANHFVIMKLDLAQFLWMMAHTGEIANWLR